MILRIEFSGIFGARWIRPASKSKTPCIQLQKVTTFFKVIFRVQEEDIDTLYPYATISKRIEKERELGCARYHSLKRIQLILVFRPQKSGARSHPLFLLAVVGSYKNILPGIGGVTNIRGCGDCRLIPCLSKRHGCSVEDNLRCLLVLQVLITVVHVHREPVDMHITVIASP